MLPNVAEAMLDQATQHLLSFNYAVSNTEELTMRPVTVHTSCQCLHADTRSVVLNGHDLLNLALRVTLGTLTVDEIKLGERLITCAVIERKNTYTLGLDHTVNEGASKAGHDLLGLLVALGLALPLAVLLVSLGGLYAGSVNECSTRGGQVHLTS